MTRLATRLIALTFVSPLFVSSTASAQRLFIDGAAFAGVERRVTQKVDVTITPPIEGTVTPVPDPNGIVAGGTLTVGTWLSPRTTVRLETSWPGQVEDRVERTQTVPAAGPVPALTSRIERQSWDRARTFVALAGYHLDRRHGVQIGFLGGASFLWRTVRQREVSSSPSLSGGGVVIGPGGVFPQPVIVTQVQRTFDATTTSYGVSAAVGVDADIALGPHMSAVPHIRVIGMPGGLSVRPGVGFRATW